MSVESGKIKTQKGSEFDKALNEILNEDIKNSVDMSDVEAYNDGFDRINQELLAYYKKHTGSDFEEQYKSELMLAVKEKIEYDIDVGDKTKDKDGISEEEERVREISNEALDGEEVDEDTKEEAIQEAEKEDSKGRELTAQEIRAIVRKEVYKQVYEKYAHDILEYKKVQAKKENITTFSLDSKSAIRCIRTEKYLNNLERSYKNYAGYYNLDNKNLENEPEIKEMKKAFEDEVKKYDKHIDRSVEDNLETIRALNNRRNEIAKKMSEIAQNDPNFSEKMDALQEEYMNVTFKINALKPSVEDYEKQLNEAGDIERIAHESGIIPQKGEVAVGEYVDRKSEIYDNKNTEELDRSQDKSRDVSIDVLKANVERLDKLMENYDENIGEIEEVLQSSEMILGIHTENQNYIENENSEKITNEELDENVSDERMPVNDRNDFMGEYQSQVATDVEATEHGIKRENIEQRIDSVKKGLSELSVEDRQEHNMNGNVLERTRRKK